MRKISESMEIATWKAIASEVQKLDFIDGTEKEFQENLERLNKIFRKLGIEENIGKRNPKLAKEIGSASLLQSIQDINVPNDYKKATFYEKIYQLSDLGIQNIEFCPDEMNFLYKRLLVHRCFDEYHNRLIMGKCYTDSLFALNGGVTLYNLEDKYWMDEEKRSYNYYMELLSQCNYILSVELLKDPDDEEQPVELRESTVTLGTFAGVFPSKEEIMKFSFPELVISKQFVSWGKPIQVKEKFETFNREEASYQKRLKIDSNNQYYYE